ncbi:hypothetical protein ACIA5C_45385 [Actinoplanes sp. NPDC051343]|uniref:hypothetical protein n=1 Tax=Actinoplanes sp. NPDC051343 TaxID=3363906 RepID=UPI0037B966E9
MPIELRPAPLYVIGALIALAGGGRAGFEYMDGGTAAPGSAARALRQGWSAS